MGKIKNRLPRRTAYMRCKKHSLSGFPPHYVQDAKFCTAVFVFDEEGTPGFRTEDVDATKWPALRTRVVIIPPNGKYWAVPILRSQERKFYCI